MATGTCRRRFPAISARAERQHPEQGHLEPHTGIRRNGQILAANQGRLVEQLGILGTEPAGQGLHLLRIAQGVIRAAGHHLLHGNPMEQRQQISQDHTVIRCKIGNPADFRQQGRAIPLNQRTHDTFNITLINGAQHIADITGRQPLVTKSDGLVGQAQGIPHTAIRGTGQKPERRFLERNLLHAQHVPQVAGNVFRCHPLEVELQAPGKHGYRQLLGICRGQQELDVFRRLLKGFQEGVERLVGQHVHLVYEVHLIAAAAWRVLDIVRQFPHIVHAGTGGGVNFDQVDKPAFLNFPATGAFPTGSRGNASFTVEASGQKTADSGLAHAPGTGEQVSVVQTLAFQGVNQRLEHVFLAHHVLKGARAPFTGKYLVAHVPSTAVKNGLNLSMDRL